MAAGFYSSDAPGLWKRSWELRSDGTIGGGDKEKYWRIIPLASQKGGAQINRLAIEDRDRVILYLFDPTPQGWQAEWCGRSIVLTPIPVAETAPGGYAGPTGIAS